MADILQKMKNRLRLIVQVGFTALTNGYVLGFIKGKIYKGPTKALCVPGLNCYSCPGALGACPIGSLQAVLGSRNYRFSFYIIGFLIFIGSLIVAVPLRAYTGFALQDPIFPKEEEPAGA